LEEIFLASSCLATWRGRVAGSFSEAQKRGILLREPWVSFEEQMEVFQTSLSGIPLLRIVGDVDHYSAPELEALARKAVVLDSGRLLFDLTAVPYIDSGGAGLLLMLDKDMAVGGWVGVIGANANLLRIFEIVGLTSRPSFRVFASVDDASAALSDTTS
jgi:anti-sigma B factor antagonist